MDRKPRLDAVAAWIVTTISYWLIVGLLVVAFLSGDCFPESGHLCPSTAEKQYSLASVSIRALILYAGSVVLITWRIRKRRKG